MHSPCFMNYQSMLRQYVLFKDKEHVNTENLDFTPDSLETIAYHLKPENRACEDFFEELKNTMYVGLISSNIQNDSDIKLEHIFQYGTRLNMNQIDFNNIHKAIPVNANKKERDQVYWTLIRKALMDGTL